MSQRGTNTFRIGSLFAVLSIACASLAALAEPVANVEFVSGNVQIANRRHETRAAQKGGALEEDETVFTYEGRVQVRFIDGGYFSLLANSQFRVDEISLIARCG
jgi:hypothetical protein